MGGFQARLGALREGHTAHLGMGQAGDESVTRPRSVEDTGRDGLQVLMARAVAAKHAIAAQGDIYLLHTHRREALGGLHGCVAMGDCLSLHEVEFQGVEAFGLALLQRLDNSGRLGGTHGINK